MAKAPATVYVCQNCGHQARKWLGKCPDCGEWNSFVEERFRATAQPTGAAKGAASSGVNLRGFRDAKPIAYGEIESQDESRTSSGIEEFDRVLGGGVVPGSMVLIGGEPGIGKCLTGATRVFDPVSGDFLPIAEWRDKQKSVLSLDVENHKLNRQDAIAFHDNGVQPVVELTTKLGRTIRCTLTHPFLTATGWKPLAEIKIGEKIAAPRALPFFGDEDLPEYCVKLAAYVLSDGSAGKSLTITTALPEVETDVRQIARAFGLTVRVYQKKQGKAKDYKLTVPKSEKAAARRDFARAFKQAQTEKAVSFVRLAEQTAVSYSTIRTWRDARGVPSAEQFSKLAAALETDALDREARETADALHPAMRFLAEIGLRFKTAKTKAVPAAIFRLPKEGLRVFLKVLFSCDGSVFCNKRGLPGVSYSTISRALAEDVQHLLLRFGFVARLRTKKSVVKNQPCTAFEIQLLGANEVKRFLAEIGIWGREKAKEKIAALPAPAFASTHFDIVPTGARFWQQLQQIKGAHNFAQVSAKTGVRIKNRRHERPLCRQTAAALAKVYQSDFLQNLAFGDVYWDEIKSVVPAGEETVYDLTVSAHANFVANDLIVHNSTLVAQMADKLSQTGAKVLYVSGEESERQIKMRGERLGLTAENLFLLPETNLENILSEIDKLRPDAVILDSIQTVFSEKIESAPGSVSQVREVAGQMMMFAKGYGVPVFLIGHVTKEGSIAGPKALEHIVDTVLYFEGERHHNHRIIRATKNRFGAANEIGVFEMTGNGLVAVKNPSEVFLQERPEGAAGSVVTVCMEGTRPMLVEIQALVSGSSYGTGRRMTQGFDQNRTALLIAVMEKRLQYKLMGDDCFINVAGGLEVDEPAADLGVVAAIASSYRNLTIPPDTAVFGEVGLTGEVRGTLQAAARAREAQALGFKKLIIPQSNKAGLEKLLGVRVVGVKSVEEALEELF